MSESTTHASQHKGDKAKTPKKKSLGLILGIVGAVLVVLLAAGGFAAYSYVYVPTQVADSLNKNIDLHNGLVERVKSSASEIESSASELKKATTQEAYTSASTKIKGKVSNLESLSGDISKTRNSLDNGINGDTKEFANLVKDNLTVMESTTSTLKDTINYYMCFGDIEYKSQMNSLKLTEAGSKFSPSQSTEEFVATAQEAQTLTRKNVEFTNAFADCMVGPFAQYKTESFTKDVKELSTYFEEYATFYDGLIQYRRTLDQKYLEAATAKLTDLNNQKPAMADKTYFDKIYAYGESEIKKQTDKLTEANRKADEKLKDVKKKYNLQDK